MDATSNSALPDVCPYAATRRDRSRSVRWPRQSQRPGADFLQFPHGVLQRIDAKFHHLDSIPTDWREWRVNATNAGGLAHTLSLERDRAILFRTLATLRTDIPLFDDVDELQWHGPNRDFGTLGARLDAAVTGTRKHKVSSIIRPGPLRSSNLAHPRYL
jgi:hypothetical protein